MFDSVIVYLHEKLNKYLAEVCVEPYLDALFHTLRALSVCKTAHKESLCI